VVVLGSGSSGNATLVESPRGRLLIDCGFSARDAARRLESAGCDPALVDGLIVTHEHADHAAGAATFSRRHGVPVHTSAATARAAGIDPAECAGLIALEPGAPFQVADIAVRPFSVPHDAVDNVGFVLSHDGARLGYVTDLGHVSRVVVEHLRSCDLLVAEANHDERMLQEGPYPWHLKQRIASRHGHLSNSQMAQLVAEVASERTQQILLAHLSQTNNAPTLAAEACRDALRCVGRSGVVVQVAAQARISREALA
jgi:phosphoribosyl 1,2-cyclic phosphodiesterase